MISIKVNNSRPIIPVMETDKDITIEVNDCDGMTIIKLNIDDTIELINLLQETIENVLE